MRARAENGSRQAQVGSWDFSWGPTTLNEILSVVPSIRRRSDFCNKIGTLRPHYGVTQCRAYFKTGQPHHGPF